LAALSGPAAMERFALAAAEVQGRTGRPDLCISWPMDAGGTNGGPKFEHSPGAGDTPPIPCSGGLRIGSSGASFWRPSPWAWDRDLLRSRRPYGWPATTACTPHCNTPGPADRGRVVADLPHRQPPSRRRLVRGVHRSGSVAARPWRGVLDQTVDNWCGEPAFAKS